MDTTQKGFEIKSQSDLTTIKLGGSHQHCILYIVHGSEGNWVVNENEMLGHSLAGLMKDIVGLDDPRIQKALDKWGIRYRSLPIES